MLTHLRANSHNANRGKMPLSYPLPVLGRNQQLPSFSGGKDQFTKGNTNDSAAFTKQLDIGSILEAVSDKLKIHSPAESPTERSPLSSTKLDTESLTIGLPEFSLSASQRQLLPIFKIPYKLTLMTLQKPWVGLTAERSAMALNSAPFVGMGDAHASALKILETAVLADMVTMPPDKAQQFIALYHGLSEPDISSNKFRTLEEQLEEVIQSIQWIGGNRKFLVIGDTLSDRGPSDRTVMNLMSRLRKQAPNCITEPASNHNENVINELMQKLLGYYRPDCPMDDPYATLSFQNMWKHYPQKDWGPLLDQYADTFKNTKLLSKVKNTLITHAPIDDNNLEKLHQLFPDKAMPPSEITKLSARKRLQARQQFIKAANDFYQEYTQEAFALFKLVQKNPEKLKDPVFRTRAEKFRHTWNQVQDIFIDARNGTNGFVWAKKPLINQSKLPFIKAKIDSLIHGHTSSTAVQSPFSLIRENAKDGNLEANGNKNLRFTIINLDQEVRKDPEQDKLLAEMSDQQKQTTQQEQNKIFFIPPK